MTTSIFKIEHQDETLSFDTMKEALVGFVKVNEAKGLLFVKVETEEVSFSRKQIKEFERLDKYPLIYTFNFAIAEVENQPVEVSNLEQLIGRTLEFESDGEAILYVRAHFDISQNKLLIEQEGENYILTWTGVTDDINYYDERAKPNRIYVRTPIKLMQFDSADEYYELED